MVATLFFKKYSLGLQAQTDAAREVFLTRVTQGNYQTLGEAWGWFLFLTLQTTYNSKQTFLHPQLTVVVVRHQQLTSLQTKVNKVIRTRFLVILMFKELEIKQCKSN
jgi:hypothetical protein